MKKLKASKVIFISVILLGSCNLSDQVEQLSGNCIFISEGPKDQIIEGENFWIPCQVTRYAYNDDFIIAAQKPTRECFRGSDNFSYSIGKDSTYYWIVVHKEGLLIGPLTRSELVSKKEFYQIPDDLEVEASGSN